MEGVRVRGEAQTKREDARNSERRARQDGPHRKATPRKRKAHEPALYSCIATIQNSTTASAD